MKICSNCGISKPETEFYSSSGRKCKVCKAEASQAAYLARRERYESVPERTCTQCGETKPKEEFYEWSGNQCKVCKKAKAKEEHDRRYSTDPEYRARVLESAKRSTQKNKEKYKPRTQAYSRARTLAKYGLTIEEYDAMLAAQGGGCAINSDHKPGGSYGKTFAVDHHHGTGKVRALLCAPCNTILGLAKEDPAILNSLADYLVEHTS